MPKSPLADKLENLKKIASAAPVAEPKIDGTALMKLANTYAYPEERVIEENPVGSYKADNSDAKYDGSAISKLAAAYSLDIQEETSASVTKEASIRDKMMAMLSGAKDKAVSALGGEKKESAVSKAGKAAAAAAVGGVAGAKYHGELADVLSKIKDQGAGAWVKAKELISQMSL